MATANIDRLEIEVEAASSAAVQHIKALSSALTGMRKSAQNATTGLSGVVQQMKALKTTGTSASKSLKVIKSALGAIGYRQIVKYLGSAVTSINEYVENVNLFQVSMGKFYQEASDYARLVSDKLGVDPSQWMRTQGVFMSMANGFGMAEEKAYALSESLTELSYDISSLYNEDIERAATRLQSALAGEIEPIRRLGISISQATLEEYALTKGINESVASMTEQEKALLRSLKLIEGAADIGAIGDFAKTLESPANAIRVLNAQLTQFKRAIGSVMLPAIIQVLPYVQAFVSLLTDLISRLAVLVGFEMPEWDSNSWSSGFGEAADSVDGVTGAVKKLKRETIGIDELNIIGNNNSGGGAGAGGTSGWAKNLDIPNLWDKNALAEIETQASKLKEKLEPILELALKVGAALLAVKIADSVFSAVSNLKEKLDGLKGAAEGVSKGRLLTIGITLAVTGAILEWDAIKEIILEGMDWENLAELVIGEASFISGGAMIGKAFGKSIMGAAIGAIIASVPALIASIYEAINNGLNTKSGLSIITNAAVLGAGIGALIAGPVGAGVGAAIGAAVGAVTDLAIYIGQNWDQIKEEAKSDWEAMKYQWEDTIRVFNEAWELGKQKIEEAFGPFWSQLKEEAKAEWDRTVTYWEDFWGDITTFVTETIPEWFENDVKPWFSIEKWKQLGKDAFNSVWQGFKDVWKDIKEWWDGLSLKKSVSYNSQFNGLGSAIVGFASGGFPDQGQMFVARESGPELVGNIGRKTAVANNDQIVAGISSGVSSANESVVSAIMVIGNMIVNAVNNKESNTYLDGQLISEKIYDYTEREKRNRGSSLID